MSPLQRRGSHPQSPPETDAHQMLPEQRDEPKGKTEGKHVPSPEGQGNASDVTPAPSDEQGKGSDVTPAPQKPALSLTQLAQAGVKPLPTTEADIPEYLYTPSSKQYEAAKIIVFEGIQDPDAIMNRTGLSKRTVSNVQGAVRRVAMKMMAARERKAMRERGQGKGTNARREGSEGNANNARNRDTSSTPIRTTVPLEDLSASPASTALPPLHALHRLPLMHPPRMTPLSCTPTPSPTAESST